MQKNGTDEPVCRAGTGEEGVEKEHVDTEAGQAEWEAALHARTATREAASGKLLRSSARASCDDLEQRGIVGWEGGSGEGGACVFIWLIHFAVHRN